MGGEGHGGVRHHMLPHSTHTVSLSLYFSHTNLHNSNTTQFTHARTHSLTPHTSARTHPLSYTTHTSGGEADTPQGPNELAPNNESIKSKSNIQCSVFHTWTELSLFIAKTLSACSKHLNV